MSFPWPSLSRAAVLVLTLLAAAGPLIGQTAAPPAHATGPYHASIRFRIEASRVQRFHHFQELVKRLEALGFKKDKGLEGEEFYADTISGVIPAANAEKIRQLPQVKTVVLVPADLKPAADQPLTVQVQVTPAPAAMKQTDLARMAAELLRAQGFHEAVGYDTQGGLRLLGTLPDASKLNELFKDQKPVAGPGGQPVTAIQQIEVLRAPLTAAPKPDDRPAPGGVPAAAKVSKDLQGLLASLEGPARDRPIRVEVVLRNLPPAEDQGWDEMLARPPVSMFVEGNLGPFVTGLVYPGHIEALAALPEVSTVRLPQAARTFVFPPLDSQHPGRLPVEYSPLGREGPVTDNLASLVRRQAPHRAAVIASDFAGYLGLVGNLLPAKTRLMDFTAERSRALLPEAMPPEEKGVLGSGTRLAIALAQAAPVEELFLVRISPDAPYQVQELARAVAGLPWQSPALIEREHELRRDQRKLDDERVELRILRRLVLDNFRDDGLAAKQREEYRARQKAFDEADKSFVAKTARYVRFQENARALKGVSTVLLGLYWPDGHVVEPAYPGLRHLDPRHLPKAAWIQAVPAADARSWTTHFRDGDGDGALDVHAGKPPHDNVLFLGWEPHGWLASKGPSPELPAGAVVQVTLQWREVHHEGWKEGVAEDHYREPIVPMQIVVLRQHDAHGKTLPRDAFAVVERSTGLPDRIENHKRYAVYQATVRFKVPEESGRFAIRIEGRQPESTLPAGSAKLPGGQQWELHPHLAVENVDPASRRLGRVVFQLPAPAGK